MAVSYERIESDIDAYRCFEKVFNRMLALHALMYDYAKDARSFSNYLQPDDIGRDFFDLMEHATFPVEQLFIERIDKTISPMDRHERLQEEERYQEKRTLLKVLVKQSLSLWELSTQVIKPQKGMEWYREVVIQRFEEVREALCRPISPEDALAGFRFSQVGFIKKALNRRLISQLASTSVPSDENLAQSFWLYHFFVELINLTSGKENYVVDVFTQFYFPSSEKEQVQRFLSEAFLPDSDEMLSELDATMQNSLEIMDAIDFLVQDPTRTIRRDPVDSPHNGHDIIKRYSEKQFVELAELKEKNDHEDQQQFDVEEIYFYDEMKRCFVEGILVHTYREHQCRRARALLSHPVSSLREFDLNKCTNAALMKIYFEHFERILKTQALYVYFYRQKRLIEILTEQKRLIMQEMKKIRSHEKRLEKLKSSFLKVPDVMPQLVDLFPSL